MPYISDEDLDELRAVSHMETEDDNHAVYMIPKEHVEEFFNYGKPQSEIAKILARELAKSHWGFDEEEAVEEDVSVVVEGQEGMWNAAVYM